MKTNRKQKAKLEINNHITCKCSKHLNQKSEFRRSESRSPGEMVSTQDSENMKLDKKSKTHLYAAYKKFILNKRNKQAKSEKKKRKNMPC